jgi:aspartyl aminopeptidase
MEERQTAEALMEAIRKSPSCFHVIRNMEQRFREAGFEKLREDRDWNLARGKNYYVTRNASSILAFRIPERPFSAMHLMASHSDSPTFKIKPAPEVNGGSCVRLNMEKYGGMILHTWLDRPLSAAGRLLCETEEGICQRLVAPDKDLLIIPSLAIHMDRTANSGLTLNPQEDMLPVFSLEGSSTSFFQLMAEEAGVAEEQILGTDLFLVNRQQPAWIGAEQEFLAAPKLDDLECAYLTQWGFLESRSENLTVHAVFDNEEVGSTTRQGAASTFLSDTLQRIAEGLGMSGSDYRRILAGSFMISADNAHAAHPGHLGKADPTNCPVINGGIVLKYHANQKYTTDGVSEAYFKTVCRKAGVPWQTFANRSDMNGGSTLGNISNTQVSVRTADIGLPQWAMHSSYETGGSRDPKYLLDFSRTFYEMEPCRIKE